MTMKQPPKAARAAILASLADLDDGTGDLAVIVDQALEDDHQVSAAHVRQIVLASAPRSCSGPRG